MPARILDLLVLARAVEAHRFRELDVAAQVAARRRGHQAAGKVALVEHETLHVRCAVEPEPAVARIDRAQAEVAFDAIDLVAVLRERDPQVVEMGSLGAPGMNRIEHDGAAAFAPAGLATVEGHKRFSLASSVNLDVHRSAVQVGCDPQVFYRARRQRLEPHRLPDPGGRGVEDPFGSGGPMLLSARDGPVGQRVLRADDHHVAPPARDAADVRRERGVAALVARHLRPVDPDRRPIVDGAEMEQQALRFRGVEAAAVPDHVAGRRVADARQR